MNNQERLSALLNDPVHPFYFPANRETDIRWLSRNIGLSESHRKNPNFHKVRSLIRDELQTLIRAEIRERESEQNSKSDLPSQSRDERLQHEDVQNIFDTGA